MKTIASLVLVSLISMVSVAQAKDAGSSEIGEELKNADGATVIRTNASCAAGKKKLISALKALDGVQEVTVDAKGTVNVTYSSDGTPYSGLLATINDSGFDANTQKASNASENPCGKK